MTSTIGTGLRPRSTSHAYHHPQRAAPSSDHHEQRLEHHLHCKWVLQTPPREHSIAKHVT
ncbi:hypothetical protein BDU57DRAFT_514301 [Ampelomyces quisqualis]|uniref:Uncharacterized protein n=1 Tax=Ampelomyces quisqualis TaxID=50730 RepID=A0A6A5QR05_AMPQU|nr:hypothetical protein BDU57DRAFT_514301 [Ampelomyces quisqualis]